MNRLARICAVKFALGFASFYRDWRRLDLWEQACNHLADDNPSLENEQLLNDVYWLGFENLYGAFQEVVTREIYQSLVERFAEAGIELPLVISRQCLASIRRNLATHNHD